MGSNIDLGSKIAPPIASTCQEQFPVFFSLSSTTLSFETRRGFINPLARLCYEIGRARARVKVRLFPAKINVLFGISTIK